MLLYLQELLSLKKTYRKYYNVDVDFCTIDIENRRLVPIHDVLKQLKHLKKELNEKVMKEVAEP